MFTLRRADLQYDTHRYGLGVFGFQTCEISCYTISLAMHDPYLLKMACCYALFIFANNGAFYSGHHWSHRKCPDYRGVLFSGVDLHTLVFGTKPSVQI